MNNDTNNLLQQLRGRAAFVRKRGETKNADLMEQAAEVLDTAAKTAAERKADERQRHKDAGRVPVTVHVLPEYRTEVRALEAKLQRRENRKRPAP